MPPLLQCHRLSHSVGTKSLFKDIDLTINAGDRIGFVGHNGSGKSTFMSLLSGDQEADGGDIARNSDLQLETVEQFINPGLHNLTLLDAVVRKLPSEERLSSQYKVEQLLQSLGFDKASFDFKVCDLSGGQQNRLMFARATINEPNLILFDEPTNHLDLHTLLVFEQFLHRMQSAFLLISHDRAFLDAVTSRTVILRDERLYRFDLPYSAAKKALEEQDAAAAAAREQEERNIRRLEQSAKRLATWGKVYDNEDLAKKAKTMEKRIERLKDERTFVTRGSGLNLTIDLSNAQANRMLHIENHDVSAPDGSPLFHIRDLMIRPGERVALLGHNGAGKTTLINLMMTRYQQQPLSDTIKFNPQVDIGYYDQELALLDDRLGMIETLRERCGGPEASLKAALIKAGFPYKDIDKKVGVLSGGEKARLMFLIIKLNQPNFLILDEPTNHIDIQGKEELEAQILESNATVLITSHDRRFVDNIADRFVLIHDAQLTEINDPATFYQIEVGVNSISTDSRSGGASVTTPDSEEAILARIVELETLLAADLERKPKFQKPKRQAAWREEIRTLNKKL